MRDAASGLPAMSLNEDGAFKAVATSINQHLDQLRAVTPVGDRTGSLRLPNVALSQRALLFEISKASRPHSIHLFFTSQGTVFSCSFVSWRRPHHFCSHILRSSVRMPQHGMNTQIPAENFVHRCVSLSSVETRPS